MGFHPLRQVLASDPRNWVRNLLQVVAGESSASCSKYCANKAAHILTTILSQDSRFLTSNMEDDGQAGEPISVEDGVDFVVTALLRACPPSGDGTMTRLGVLESLANLLKNPEIRRMVWEHSTVSHMIFSVERDAAPPLLYKSVFAMWLCSFDEELAVSSHGLSLKSQGAVDRLRSILAASRVEKIVRLGLAAYREVRREALLCCQKIMLDRWQEVSTAR